MLYQWSGLFSLIANGVIGFAVFANNPKDKINRVCAVFIICVGGWSSGSFFANVVPKESVGLFLLRSSYLLGVWVPAFYIYFVQSIAGDKSDRANKTLKVSLGISTLFSCFVFSPLFIKDIRLIEAYNFRISQPGFVYYIFFSYFALGMVEVLRMTFIELKSRKLLSQAHFKYIAAANCLAIIAGFEYFMRVFKVVNAPPFDDYILVVYTLVLAFAIVRHRLFSFQELAELFRRDKMVAIGTLSTGINHEIRNPLYIANSLAHTALEKKENVEDNLEKIIEQTSRAMDIIKRFSMFAKQNTDQTPQQEDVAIQETLKTVMPLAQHELSLEGITLETNIPENLPTLKVDPRHMEEILFNLIVNALQAIKGNQKEGLIEISACEKEGKVEITVSDNGPGIVPEDIRNVFKPFHTTKEEGTGLGLYITKQLVERNGGQINVTVNTKKQGTTFRLVLANG